MSKSDLKAAMESLQVRKPLRLSTRAPSFTPPTEAPPPTPVENQTQVGNPTEVQNPAMVGSSTSVSIQTQVANPTVAQNPTEDEEETTVQNATSVSLPTEVSTPAPVEDATPVANPSSVEMRTEVQETTPVEKATLDAIPAPVSKTTSVRNQTQVSKQTQVGNATEVTNVTEVRLQTPVEVPPQVSARRVTEQDSSVILEARAAEGLEKGYTRLPNTTLMRLASGDFTRNEIKLALLIARFTISFQRKHAPLSKNVLERQSGLRGPAVLEALSGLVAKGLIEKVQGDMNRPNLLGLALPPNWDELMNPNREKENTSVEIPTSVQKPTLVGETTSASVGNPTPAGVGNPTCFKDIEIYSNNSLSTLPESLRKYFESLKPAKKRESEWKFFQELQSDYPAQDIADCVSLLQKRGVLGSAEGEFHPCHSPMAYLAKAMGEVLSEVEAGRKKLREREERFHREAEAAQKKRETEEREAAEWAEKERAFGKAFPTDELRLEAFTKLLRGLPFAPTSQPGRIMAIGKWWDELSGQPEPTL